MVVRFDLERDSESITDVDDAGILTGTLQHPRRLGRQLFEEGARVLVTAVLRPQRAEQTELGVCGFAAEHIQNFLILVFTQPMLGNEIGCDLRITFTRANGGYLHQRAPRPTSGALAATSDSNNPRPSVEPRMPSTERSGWGIKPRTLPFSLM